MHHCHAKGCKVAVPPEFLMCRRHWYMVPRQIQSWVCNAYRPGQCDDKNPSAEWRKAADAAIRAVADEEEGLL